MSTALAVAGEAGFIPARAQQRELRCTNKKGADGGNMVSPVK